uniref:Uncharacterized protein n=1 Tax=Plectus sambesii TaxID=2011161 RepID=A0A914XPE8_9BILA
MHREEPIITVSVNKPAVGRAPIDAPHGAQWPWVRYPQTSSSSLLAGRD